MTDIVDRLRLTNADFLHEEAADEIERLREERDRLAADLVNAHKDILPWIDQVGWLNGEYDRLRKALRQVAHSAYYDSIYSPDGERHETAIQIAIDALGGDT